MLGRRRIEQQILGQAALFFGERGEALQAFGVDDGQVQPGFRRVVEEHGIHHFARGGGQSEGDVGDSQHGFDEGDFGLHHPDRLDGFDGASDVVFVAGGTGENQGVNDDVLGRDAVLFRQDLHRALRHGEFALAGEGLRLHLIFVDGADDQRPAVGSRSGQTSSNFSSPSSRLTELMMHLPWHHIRALSMALGSVVSTITGALILGISFE